MRSIALVCCVAGTAFAQMGGGYLGPGVLSNGAAGVGNRSGQQVDLRFYAGVNGVYDSSVQPASVDSKGNLIVVNGLVGVEASLGAYGTHSWRTALLGLDYHGVFRAYTNNSSLNGIDQTLNLGYTWQKSRRIVFNGQVVGGVVSNALSGYGYAPPTITSNQVVLPTSNLFDSRAYFVQGGLNMTYVQTARTSYNVGGQAFEVWRQAGLIGSQGFNVRGSIDHKVNKTTSVGLIYFRQHFEFPHAYGTSDIDTAELYLGTNLGRFWQLTVNAGAFHSEVAGLQEVTLSPVIAALLGQATTVQSFYAQNILPTGQVSLDRRFKQANLRFYWGRAVTPGNGVYLTSRTDGGGATYSYTATHKLSLSVSGGYFTLGSLGLGLQPYKTFNAGGGFTYGLPKSLHLVGRYDFRNQDIQDLTYKHTGSRVTFGVTYSPGNVPLSLW